MTTASPTPLPSRILVVEDETSIADVVATALRYGGHRVVHAPGGLHGLEQAEREAFDLIVLDVMLPGLDGFEVCRRLRDGGHFTPVLFLTARAEPDDRIKGFDGRVSLTALPLDQYDAAVGRFRTSLALGGGVILALVAIVLWVLTGYLARPVTRLATLANRIADGELDTAVGEPSGSRETAELTTDLDRMLDRLRAAIDEATSSRDAMERFLADMAQRSGRR